MFEKVLDAEDKLQIQGGHGIDSGPTPSEHTTYSDEEIDWYFT